MIEVNRRLYMTADGSKTDSFSDIQRMLAALVGEIEML